MKKTKKEVAVGLEQLDRGEKERMAKIFKELLEEIAIEEQAR